jgi:hypothetical protein
MNDGMQINLLKINSVPFLFQFQWLAVLILDQAEEIITLVSGQGLGHSLVIWFKST